MSDENDGLGQIRLDADELALKLTAHERVDCAERLIHQQNTGVGGQRPGHPDALGLSAGELVGISLSEVTIQAQHVDQFQSTITGSSAIDPAEAGHEGDVVDDAAVREQARILHDVADGAPERDGIAIAHVLAVEQDTALGGIDHAIDHAQQRGLAAAGGAEQHGDRARGQAGGERLDGGWAPERAPRARDIAW